MGDNLKISKEKRHKSSSSIGGGPLESTRSERKLGTRASIPEVDDQFALAEARCADLQEKLNVVKNLKKKKKFKKRSMTRLNEPPLVENVPFISVRTQPKKKKLSQSGWLRRQEPPLSRGYVDPDTTEQHRMISQYRDRAPKENRSLQQNMNKMPHLTSEKWPMSAKNISTSSAKPSVYQRSSFTPRNRRNRGDSGDSTFGGELKASTEAVGDDQILTDEYLMNEGLEDGGLDQDLYDTMNKGLKEDRETIKSPNRRSRGPKNFNYKEEDIEEERLTLKLDRRRNAGRNPTGPTQNVTEERPIVELFNKSRASENGMPLHGTSTRMKPVSWKEKMKRARDLQKTDKTVESEQTKVFENVKEKDSYRLPRRAMKVRSRRYEMPTVASLMKQAGVRYYYASGNSSQIPFINSKSTAPSHNIGVNIQQVLNGLKIKQPLSGIPLSIAHHMGLGHIDKFDGNAVQQRLNPNKINAIRLGQRLLRLPTYKYISYGRLLKLYREGDGMVPRFLRSVNRPHYFYSSMHNLMSHRDYNGMAKNGTADHETRENLTEYSNIYREYEELDKRLRESPGDAELERRKDELARDLAAREAYIRNMANDYRPVDGDRVFRASSSPTHEGRRSSSMHLGEHQL